MKSVLKLLLLFTVVIGPTLYLTNCRPDLEPSEVISRREIYDAEGVQKLFNKNAYADALLEKISDSLQISWKPNWTGLYFEVSKDSTYFFYIPLTPELKNTKTNYVNSQAKFDGFVKYIILESTPNKRNIFYIGKYTSSAESGTISLHNFTGTLLLRNLENSEISYYKFDNGKRKSNRIVGASGSNLKSTACVAIVTCSWGNWNCGGVNIASTTNEVSCDPPSWSPCYGAVWEINSSESMLSCDSDPNDPNSPGVPITLDPEFINGVAYTPPSIPVSNVPDYLKCFNTLRSAAAYKVSIYADQPVSNSHFPFNPAAQGKHTVGHAFIEFEMTMPRSNLYPSGDLVRRSIGFYPKGTANPLHPKSEGVMGNDAGYNGTLDVVASFTANESEFNAMLKLAESYANGGYDINTRNCSNFTSDALALMGVNIPSSWQQSYWYTAAGVNVTGPSLGFYVDLIKELQSTKLKSRSASDVVPKSNIKVCN